MLSRGLPLHFVSALRCASCSAQYDTAARRRSRKCQLFRAPLRIFVIALVSLLLLGCSGVKEKQEQAADFVEGAAENLKGSIERAKEAGEQWTVVLSGTTKKVQATVSEVQERVSQVQDGVKKVQGAVETLTEGVKEVKEAVGGGE